MKLPELKIAASVVQLNTDPENGVEPQIFCRIGDIVGTRTKRRCTGPRWARVCVNVPEVKHGACHSDGADCNDCFARCKSQFTSAGGWHIKNVGSMKCPN